ncbi:MAG: hypothetical protein WCT03_11390 [Candidatus Obscuribacterales bacterium]|jgi:hypothetical protein
MQGQFEVNDGSRATTNQSGQSSSLLFEEYAQEVRPVRPPSPSVAAADGPHSGDSSQRQGAFPTFMLGQEHILLNSVEVPSFKAPVPTSREVPAQIAPSNAESSEMKSKAEISAKIRENLDPCSVLFALDTAKALDENNLPEAQRLLKECGLDNPALLQDLKAVQDFALQIDYFDDKNQGLNLNLRWKLDAGDVYNLNRAEIGEANW